jgi:hypothetical protein
MSLSARGFQDAWLLLNGSWQGLRQHHTEKVEYYLSFSTEFEDEHATSTGDELCAAPRCDWSPSTHAHFSVHMKELVNTCLRIQAASPLGLGSLPTELMFRIFGFAAPRDAHLRHFGLIQGYLGRPEASAAQSHRVSGWYDRRSGALDFSCGTTRSLRLLTARRATVAANFGRLTSRRLNNCPGARATACATQRHRSRCLRESSSCWAARRGPRAKQVSRSSETLQQYLQSSALNH